MSVAGAPACPKRSLRPVGTPSLSIAPSLFPADPRIIYSDRVVSKACYSNVWEKKKLTKYVVFQYDPPPPSEVQNSTA